MLRLYDTPQGPGRRQLWGTLAEIGEDIRRYAEGGLTDLLLEANLDPAGPRVEQCIGVMEAFAPIRGGG